MTPLPWRHFISMAQKMIIIHWFCSKWILYCHLQKCCHHNFTNLWYRLCELCSLRYEILVQGVICTSMWSIGPRGRIWIGRWDADTRWWTVMGEKTIYNWPEDREGSNWRRYYKCISSKYRWPKTQFTPTSFPFNLLLDYPCSDFLFY